MITDRQERRLKLWIHRRINGCKPHRRVVCSEEVKAHDRACLMAYEDTLMAIKAYKAGVTYSMQRLAYLNRQFNK